MPKKEEDRKKKAQSAMEFLLTYGWALIVIIIILSSLYFIGVFNPKTQSSCSIIAPFVCRDFKATEDSVTYVVGSSGVNTAEVTNVEINGEDCENDLGGTIWIDEEEGEKTINPKVINQVSCKGITLDPNQKISSKITISYTKIIGGVGHTLEGAGKSGVVEGEPEGPEPPGNNAPTVTLLSPEDNAPDVEIPVTFTWNGNDIDGDTLTYDVYVREEDVGEYVVKCNVPNDEPPYGGNCVVGDLEYDTPYQWYVTVTDGEDSTQSEVETFRTISEIDFTDAVLILHLDDEQGETFIDASGEGNDGSCSGDTCPTRVAGRVGDAAYEFDGINDVIDISDSPEIKAQRPMSVSAWIKRDVIGENDFIFTKRGSGWGFRVDVDNKLLFVFFGIAAVKSTDTITDTDWHYVVATVSDGGDVTFYIDGADAGSDTIANAPFTTIHELLIGVATDVNGVITGYYDMTLDEVVVWAKELTAVEVSDMYNAYS